MMTTSTNKPQKSYHSKYYCNMLFRNFLLGFPDSSIPYLPYSFPPILPPFFFLSRTCEVT